MLLKAVAALSNLVVPLMIAVICIAGYAKKVRVYETFIEGAKDGFAIAIRLVPFLVGMFVAIGIFRESGFSFTGADSLTDTNDRHAFRAVWLIRLCPEQAH